MTFTQALNTITVRLIKLKYTININLTHTTLINTTDKKKHAVVGKSVAPPPPFLIFFFLHPCHTLMFQIIKQIKILIKDNTSKHNMQFLNDVFYYEGEKTIQTHMALCEEAISKKKQHFKSKAGNSGNVSLRLTCKFYSNLPFNVF